MSRALALGTLAVLALLASSSRAAPPALEPAWQRIAARLDLPPRPLATELDAAFAGLSAAEVATASLPAESARLRAVLADAGLSADEIAVLQPLVLQAARDAASPSGSWTEPTVRVGSLEMSLADLHDIVGPREGRDRRTVAARLRATVRQGAAGLSEPELENLVPDLVAAADAVTAERLVARLRRVLIPAEARQ